MPYDMSYIYSAMGCLNTKTNVKSFDEYISFIGDSKTIFMIDMYNILKIVENHIITDKYFSIKKEDIYPLKSKNTKIYLAEVKESTAVIKITDKDGGNEKYAEVPIKNTAFNLENTILNQQIYFYENDITVNALELKKSLNNYSDNLYMQEEGKNLYYKLKPEDERSSLVDICSYKALNEVNTGILISASKLISALDFFKPTKKASNLNMKFNKNTLCLQDTRFSFYVYGKDIG